MTNRKIEALQNSASQKAKLSAERVDKALETMVKQGQIINFKSVAQSANVSTAYLYKQSDLRNRIEKLRDQQHLQPKAKQIPLASDSSKAVIIANLRESNKQLKAENEKLRQINESLTGELYKLQGANDLKERFRLENEKLTQEVLQLKKELAYLESNFPRKVISITKASSKAEDIPEFIHHKLSVLNVKINLSLTKLIIASHEQEVIKALLAVEQYIQYHSVRNINGLVLQAIKEKWSPSDSLQKLTHKNIESESASKKVSHDNIKKELLSTAELLSISNIFMDNSND
ncbi:MAG: hypothetical protein HC908_00395 [Calothrix sp. SM1_7_51]|nr:hypothetical protein [Calothrix sp. SM1_7_51]